MFVVRLPPEMERRLEALAKATGRTKTFHVREAVIGYLDDLEDWHRAVKVLNDVRSGREETVPIEEVMREHGLLAD